jgi:cardiolipin synthase
MPQNLRTVLLLSSLVLVAGCASSGVTNEDLAASCTGLEVVEALAGDDVVYLRCAGAIEADLDLGHYAVLFAQASPNGEVLLAPLEFLDREAWAEAAAGSDPVHVFTVSAYDELLDEVIEGLCPAEPGTGIILRGARGQFLVWRQPNGIAHLSRPEDVIEQVEIVGHRNPDDIRAVALEILERRLPADRRRVVIETAQEGPGATPFLYVDLDRDVVTLLQLTGELDRDAFEPVGRTAETGMHLIVRSIFLEIPRSPVRFATRAAFYGGYTAYDAVFQKRSFGGAPEEPPPLNDGPPMDLEAFDERLDKLTGTERVPGRITRSLIGGDEYFTVLQDAIARAEKTIHIRTYIFDNDDFAVELADQLRAKAAEGIDVKILTDGLGTINASRVDPPSMPVDFEKPKNIGPYLERDSDLQYRGQSNPLAMGDHAKTTIIDGDRAWVGGMNLGREYRYDWHDVMLEVEGPVVDVLEQQFRNVWELAGFFGDWSFALYGLFGDKVEQRDARDGDYPIRVLKTVPGGANIYKAQIEAMRRAQRYIYIESPYYSNALFLEELIAARRRGVDVRVIMPSRGNHGIVSDAAMVTANRLFEAGVRVYLYNGMTHVKAAVYDGWACVGSANFDKLSFRVNEELNLAYTDPEAVAELIERLFEADFAASEEMTDPLDTDARHALSAIITNQL